MGIIIVFVLVLLVTSGVEVGNSATSAKATYSKLAEFLHRGLFPSG